MQTIRNIFYTQTERSFYEKNFHPRIMNEKNFHKCYTQYFYTQTFFTIRTQILFSDIPTVWKKFSQFLLNEKNFQKVYTQYFYAQTFTDVLLLELTFIL